MRCGFIAALTNMAVKVDFVAFSPINYKHITSVEIAELLIKSETLGTRLRRQ